MTGRGRRGPLVLLAGALGLMLILAAGICGGWQSMNIVPPYVPHLPPGPSPNGYLAAERAAAALQNLTPATPTAVPGSGGPSQAVPQSRWPEGPPVSVRARLVRIRPLLNQVRAQFRYAGSAAPDLPNPRALPPFSGFRECARGFAAESTLCREEKEHAAAMPPALDALLTPRSLTLTHIDDHYRRAAHESRKPVRRRRSVPEPMDFWPQLALGLDPLGLSDRLERLRTDLALLEVALAVCR